MINERIIQQKVESLKTFPLLNSNSIDKFSTVLKEQDDWHLLRINPLTFAEKHNIEEKECIDLFIHAAKIGLFDFAYNMLCPVCGGIVHSHHELDELEEENFHCQVCNVDVPTFLDDQVEVTFTIHPDVKTLQIDPLQDINNYYRYHFSENFERNIEYEDMPHIISRKLIVLEPDETSTILVEKGKYSTYSIVSVEYNTGCWVFLDEKGKAEQKEINVDLLPKGFSPSKISLVPGDYSLNVTNRTKKKWGFVVKAANLDELMELMEKSAVTVHPFFTANQLINNQSFRDLFRVQRLSESLRLNVRNLTIMFTDLRGSTAMYDEAGDMLAYQLVREHFKLLSESVRAYSGAIVKTMGDAIMATFTSPLNGFLCALDMIGKIDALNDEWKQHGYEIGLKVGLNSGSALTVVNDERLDYFGQSVNIAARIQGLAQSSEIYLSDSIYKEAGIEQLLAMHGYVSEWQEASLKGVGEVMPVHKVYQELST
ncbi:DUF5939 domain-containing protein [Anaerolineales bacterium HSG24]|nr:DUF5939 domain-containing protein [Anaerolineales bacterium HSG24]